MQRERRAKDRAAEASGEADAAPELAAIGDGDDGGDFAEEHSDLTVDGKRSGGSRRGSPEGAAEPESPEGLGGADY